MRKLVFGLVTAALALLCVLGALEVVLRLAPGHDEVPPSTKIPSTSYVEPDQPDFRDRHYQLTKSPGTFRILAVGDSFTRGSGVHSEDAYPDRLERRMRALGLARDGRVEVINWSRSGWNTAYELQTLRDNIDALEPDLVILGLCLNDAESSNRTERQALQQRYLTEREEDWFLARHSRLAGWLDRRVRNLRQRRLTRTYYRLLYEPGPAYRTFRRSLRGIGELTAERSIPLVVAIFPIFDPEMGSDYPYAALHGVVRRLLQDLDIPSIDLLRAYRDVDGRRLAVEPFDDVHPNELAHRIAADRILARLLADGLIPDESELLTAPSGEASVR